MDKQRSSRGAKTLPGEFFRCPNIYALETERIFAANWLCVGREAELPNAGDFLMRTLGGESAIVVRDDAGSIRGFHNVCRHRGTQLTDEPCGRFKSRIQCPYHAWSYDLSGALTSAPNMSDVAGFDASEFGLHSIPCATWQGFIWINLDAEGESFDSVFQSILHRFDAWELERLVSVHQIVYELEANWKLFFHNYNECYHCSLVHPQLNPVTSVQSASNDLSDGPFLGGPMVLTDAYQTISTDGALCGERFPKLEEEDRRRVYFYTLFPSLFVAPHPDYVLTHRIERRGAGATRIVCDWLFAPEVAAQDGFDPTGAVEFWDLTNRQDWEICQRTHRGVQSSAYEPGPYSNLESVLAAFDRHYLQLMEPSE